MEPSERTYLEQIRHHLHKHPERSGEEEETAAFITSELKKTQPDKLFTHIGGHGVVAVYGPGTDGPKVMLRAELDALPIREEGDHDHVSTRDGYSHACGHDGHMAVMLGVARHLGRNRPESGQVSVLFQPSEETGEGALRMIDDDRFDEIRFDRCYAFHNLPGYTEGMIWARNGVFAAASTGLICRLRGSSSHAAYPGQGRSPAPVIADLIRTAGSAGVPDPADSRYSIATVTWLEMGERAFGITPGDGEAGITLRAAGDDLLVSLQEEIRSQITASGEEHGVAVDFRMDEPFAATVNDVDGNRILQKAAESSGLKMRWLDYPFPWSEDFGRFSQISRTVLFGIGAGQNHSHLHAGRYDFNDKLLEPTVTLFIQILEKEWETI